jgi:hypothetical protein
MRVTDREPIEIVQALDWNPKLAGQVGIDLHRVPVGLNR